MRLVSPRSSSSGGLGIAVAALVNDIAVVDGVGVQVRLDGAAAWLDAVNGTAYNASTGVMTLSGYAEGNHSVEVRANVSAVGVDATPTTIVWRVSSVAPIVRAVSAPLAWSHVPCSSARFVLSATPAVWTTMSWQLASCGSSMTSGVCEVVSGNNWTAVVRNAVTLTGLTPGVGYRLDVRSVDSSSGVSGVTSWHWQSAACVSTEDAAIVGVAVKSVSLGSVVVTWAALASRERLAGYAYALDWGNWVHTGQPYAILRNVTTATWHTVHVRAVNVADCDAVVVVALPSSSASWFEYESAPGVPSFSSVPDDVARSVYATFTMTGTAAPGSFMFQYSLDGSSWSECSGTLSLSRLSPGYHVVGVRTVAVSGVPDHDGENASTIWHEWLVAPVVSATLELSDLSEGVHTLSVTAVAEDGVMEEPSVVYAWEVDMTPPMTSAVLLSRKVSNAATANVSVTCGGEAHPDRCEYCWRLRLDGVALSSSSASCSMNSTLWLPSPANGVVDAVISAYDGAGNAGNEVVVSWVSDTTPPVATVTLATPAVWVPSLAARAVTTSYVTLHVTGNEPMNVVNVDMRNTDSVSGVSVRRSLEVVDGVVNVTSLADGRLWLTVTGVDVAGNAAVTPTTLMFVVAAALPTVTITHGPPSLGNKRELSLTVTSPGYLWMLLSGYDASSTPVLDTLPSWSVVGDVDSSTTTIAFVVNVSAAYCVVVTAVSVVNSSSDGVERCFVVDLDPPSSSIAPLPSYVKSSTVQLGTTASDALSNVTIAARVDGGMWQADNTVFTALSNGRHVFEVLATDAAGNVQSLPLPAVATIVDTIAPLVVLSSVAGVVTPLPSYVRSGNVSVCAVVEDASPVVVTMTLDGVSVALSSAGCGTAVFTSEGNHTIAASAVDAAGNPSVAVSVWVVYDATPPSHTLSRRVTVGCVTMEDVTSCRSAASAVFGIVCVASSRSSSGSGGGDSDGGGVVVAPCVAQWSLQQYVGAAGCGGGSVRAPTAGEWVTVPALANGTADLTDAVQAFVDVHAVARFVVITRSVDAAGNVDDSQSFEWWVDTQPPQPPRAVSVPDAVSLTSLSLLSFQLEGNASPGHVSFVYTLTCDGVVYTLPSGNPVIAVPAPSNNDPVLLGLSGLPPDRVYTVTIHTLNQCGLASVNATVVTWQILSSPPSVVVVRRPDAVSGSPRPEFEFAVNWAVSTVADVGVRNVTYEVLLLSDADLGAFHEPPVCDRALAGSASQRDCVEAGCSASSCRYSVALSLARGTSHAYTLQVRTRLFSGHGVVVTVPWTYVRCAPTEFSSMSGNDSVQCVPCPAGGDCSGNNLPLSMLVADSGLVDVNSSAAVAAVVVSPSVVVAQSGYWMSPDSDDLTFYQCPQSYACLAGNGDARSRCAAGYEGVLCSVCSPGYFNQYAYCVLCKWGCASALGSAGDSVLAG